jgi:hypothetical protein
MDGVAARRPRVPTRQLGAVPLSRRAFLRGAAALGVASTSLPGLFAACSAAAPSASPSPGPVITAWPQFSGTVPVVDPPPASATYGEMLEARELVAIGATVGVAGLVREVAADADLTVAPSVVAGRHQVRLTFETAERSLPSQAYRLSVSGTTDGVEIELRSGDEAGAWNGLASLRRLIAADGATRWVRTASIDDAPAFARRGAIMDAHSFAAGGVTAVSRSRVLDHVRFGAAYKLNFVDILDRDPWPELVSFCRSHHVEVMSGLGYRDVLTQMPRLDLHRRLDTLMDGGIESFSFAWDDLQVSDPASMAALHALILQDVYDYIHHREPEARISAVFPPYGGIPGKHLVASAVGEGEAYLAVMRDRLPQDVRVFWTGDGGVFSPEVTVAGATAYADAVGREVALWDNDALDSVRSGAPCRGRAADLATVVPTYMSNLASETNWAGSNGHLALLTELAYTWNPGAYDPERAADDARRILADDPPAIMLPSIPPPQPR